MDYSAHTEELEFQLLLRQKLIRYGASFLLDQITNELNALAGFLEDSGDKKAIAFRKAATALNDVTTEITILLNE